MDLSAIQRQIREAIISGPGFGASVTQDSLRSDALREIDRLPRDVRKQLGDSERDTLAQRVCDDFVGAGPLQPLLNDPAITEIMVTAPDTIYVERNGSKEIAPNRFTDVGHVRAVVERMISESARRLDERMPYADFALADGSRVHVIIPPLALDCPQITIRKFLDTISGISDLIAWGTLDERMARFLAACILGKKNLLFSGATGCGKTTTLAALSAEIDPKERIITIEDTRELNLLQQHVVSLLTRPANIEGTGEITLRDLMRNSLRMRPSRILLGEIRGEEALDFLQALNSGHRGCSAVLHASSPRDALYRLETLALFAGLGLPVDAIRQQIASGLDIIVQQEQIDDGSRKVTHVSEVRGMANGEVVVQDLFRYEVLSTAEDGTISGEFIAVTPPADLGYFTRRGIELPHSLFTERKVDAND